MAFSIKDFSDIKKLGEGGMGNVYLATQVALDRKVVIKELASNMSNDPKLIRRFENEAKSAAGLDHDNIVRVFDFGEDSHSFFISMEYIDGLDLEQLMRWRPFPREIGLMILLQALKGLHYAHNQGIVHCDVKPGNILISKTGKVKVVDFGLAHASTRSTDFIDPSSVYMTPGYMPPEMASGSRGQDIHMDIWSTGVLAYKIIAGTLPFASEDMRALVYSIVHRKEKDLQMIVPTLPAELAEAVRACLQKTPQDRPASLGPLIEALENYIYDLGVRDVEKMIMNYVADKQSVVPVLAGLLLQYHMQKGNEYLDAGNRVLSDAHFREAEKYGVIDQKYADPEVHKVQKNSMSCTSLPGLFSENDAPVPVLPRTWKPGFISFAFFKKLATVKRVILVSAIFGILIAGAVSVFMAVQNSQNTDIQTGTDVSVATTPDNAPGNSSPAQVAAGPSTADNDLAPAPAAPRNEVSDVNISRKSPLENPKKVTRKSVRTQATIPHERKPAPLPVVVEVLMGVLKLTAEPSSATITIDGEKVSAAELAEGKRLKPGNHSVVVFSDGYSQYSSNLTIEPNATQFASISLKQKEKGTGLLHVHSYPWAEIYIDESYQGTAPTPKPLSLPEGDHVLVLKRDGFKPHTETVHVAQGEVTRIKVQLEQ